MSTLEGEGGEVTCSICLQEYGTGRGSEGEITTSGGGTTEQSAPASGKFDNDQEGFPSEEAPEYPVKISCGHVNGERCIKRWLLEQPASCPTCRLHFNSAT